MPKPQREQQFANFGEYLYWRYACFQMLLVAIKRGVTRYDTLCFMVRAKFFKGYKDGRFSPSSLLSNTIARFIDTDHCWYCGTDKNLTRDHILPLSKGGPDTAENIIMACRRCNSSKGDADPILWFHHHFGPPPVFLWASYLKLVHQYALTHSLMEMHYHEMKTMTLPFDPDALFYDFPLEDFLPEIE